MKPAFLTLLILSLWGACTNFVCTPAKTDCLMFKTGRFMYHSKLNRKYYILERTDSVQTEIDSANKRISKNKIFWKNDCEYYLVNMPDSNQYTDGIDSFFKANPMTFRIIKTASTYYIYHIHIDSAGKVLDVSDTVWVQKVNK